MTIPLTLAPDERQLPEAVARLVVVDDDPDIRSLVGYRLRRAGMDLVGEACDGAEAVEVVRSTQPDVVVLDLDMPTPGEQALPFIIGAAPSAMVVVFSAATLSDARRQELLTKGAFAYYDKEDASRLGELLTVDLARCRGARAGEDPSRAARTTCGADPSTPRGITTSLQGPDLMRP